MSVRVKRTQSIDKDLKKRIKEYGEKKSMTIDDAIEYIVEDWFKNTKGGEKSITDFVAELSESHDNNDESDIVTNPEEDDIDY